jgi:hypothetical protein
MESGCIDPHFLDLGTSWRRVVNFTPRPFYPWIGGWVDLRAGLNDLEKRKFLTLPRLELRPLSRPARSQSLYRLRYPSSYTVCVVSKKRRRIVLPRTSCSSMCEFLCVWFVYVFICVCLCASVTEQRNKTNV